MALVNPLKNRFTTQIIPLILCGPILRRVDFQIVSVWVALKEPRRIKLHLYLGYCKGDTDKNPDFSSGFIETQKIGEHLHLAVAYVPTKGLLRNGGIYSYDLHFYAVGSETKSASLATLEPKLLQSPILLGFKENQLPSFVYAPEKLEDLRIAHGSCRKPHGKGRDGLAAEERQGTRIEASEQRLNSRIDLVAAELKNLRTELKGELTLLKWMFGVGVTVGLGVLVRLFLFRGPI